MWNTKHHFYLETVSGEVCRKNDFNFAFISLEKAVDQVPRDVVWWALMKLLSWAKYLRHPTFHVK